MDGVYRYQQVWQVLYQDNGSGTPLISRVPGIKVGAVLIAPWISHASLGVPQALFHLMHPLQVDPSQFLCMLFRNDTPLQPKDRWNTTTLIGQMVVNCLFPGDGRPGEARPGCNQRPEFPCGHSGLECHGTEGSCYSVGHYGLQTKRSRRATTATNQKVATTA